MDREARVLRPSEQQLRACLVDEVLVEQQSEHLVAESQLRGARIDVSHRHPACVAIPPTPGNERMNVRVPFEIRVENVCTTATNPGDSAVEVTRNGLVAEPAPKAISTLEPPLPLALDLIVEHLEQTEERTRGWAPRAVDSPRLRHEQQTRGSTPCHVVHGGTDTGVEGARPP